MSTMRLIHYSSAYLTEVRSVAQTINKGGMRGDRAMKPLGLWVSAEGENDWPAWCRGESFGAPLSHPTELILREQSGVLHLATEAMVRAFHQEFGCSPHYADRVGDRTLFCGSAVRWADVAAKHSGIVIAPYIWALRLDCEVRWYYPWDCASGCIWDAAAVAELRPLPQQEIAASKAPSPA